MTTFTNRLSFPYFPEFFNETEKSTRKLPNSRPSALIIEDAADTRLIISRILESHGIECFSAENPKEGLKLIRSHKPDIVLLDLMLPEMNGLQFLVKLKELNVKSKICIVSGHFASELVNQAFKLGASDYIVKPISSEILIHKVDNLLNRYTSNKFFAINCHFAGYIVSENHIFPSTIDHINELGVEVDPKKLPDLSGKLVQLKFNALSEILGKDEPVYALSTNRKKPNFFEFVGLPESCLESLRALVIKGRYISDTLLEKRSIQSLRYNPSY